MVYIDSHQPYLIELKFVLFLLLLDHQFVSGYSCHKANFWKARTILVVIGGQFAVSFEFLHLILFQGLLLYTSRELVVKLVGYNIVRD